MIEPKFNDFYISPEVYEKLGMFIVIPIATNNENLCKEKVKNDI